MVVIKLSVIVLFVLVGVFFIQKSNWVPFIPENTGHFGDFGWSGILRASGLVFFAYLGFDTVSTLAQDAKDPQNDLPKGILGSLGVSTLAYIIVSLVLTGIASYTLLGVADPIAVALRVMGPNYLWLSLIVKLAILAGLSSVVLVQMLGQSRVFMAMGQDGLLPSIFRKVDARYQTPRASSWITVTICMALAAVFPVEISGQLVSMSALFVYAMICFAVLQLRQTHPEYKRPFKVPGVPFVPLLGAAACFGQMAFLPLVTWAQMGVWLVIGLFVYFSYGVRNSVLRKR
jgi:APA family basic amino acid/polyamine antiporter